MPTPEDPAGYLLSTMRVATSICRTCGGKLAWGCPACELAAAQEQRWIRTANERDDAITRLRDAEAALARADALVRECEWKATAFVIGDDSKTYVAAACPICRRPQPDGHTLDCALAAHLRDREGGAA